MRERYLVTAVGGDIGSSVVSCLNQEFLKEDLLGCDITPYVAGYDEIGAFFCVPPYADEIQYMDVLLNECRERGITHILPMTEEEIIIFDKYRKLFASKGIKVMIQDSNLLEKMLKGYSLQEYESAIFKLPGVVIQEYMGNFENEYTVTVFSNGREIKTIAFKRTLGFGGMSRMVERIEDEKIDQIAETIAHNFDLRGSINIQMRKQKDQYYIFEIDPRISSTVGFRYQLGFKDIKWWLDLLNGKNDQIYYVPEALPIVGIRTFGKKIFNNDLDLQRKFELYSQQKEQDKIGGVLLLSNNPLSVLLYEWMVEQGITVSLYSEKLTVSKLRQLSPSFVISYNYRHIVSKEVIQYLQREIINLHISYLPWNRGSNPNVWSFITDTPKGITIHYIDEGLDSGDILIQKQVWFEEERETFESTYEALNDLILLTLKENWDSIINQKIPRMPQKEGMGSYHTKKEFEEFLNGRDIDFKENITKFKQRMKISKKFP